MSSYIYENFVLTFVIVGDVIYCNVYDFTTFDDYHVEITKQLKVIEREKFLTFFNKCLSTNETNYSLSISFDEKKSMIMEMNANLDSCVEIKEIIYPILLNQQNNLINTLKTNILLRDMILSKKETNNCIVECNPTKECNIIIFDKEAKKCNIVVDKEMNKNEVFVELDEILKDIKTIINENNPPPPPPKNVFDVYENKVTDFKYDSVTLQHPDISPKKEEKFKYEKLYLATNPHCMYL